MGAYQSLKTKAKSSSVIPKVVAVTYESFHYKVSVTVQTGFTKVILTRADRRQDYITGPSAEKVTLNFTKTEVLLVATR